MGASLYSRVSIGLLFVTFAVVQAWASCRDDEAANDRAPTPQEIALIARGSASALLAGNFMDCTLCDLRNHSYLLNRKQLEAMSPLLVQLIVEQSRNGVLYKTAEGDPNKVYLVVEPALAVEFENDLMAELTNRDGKVIAKWQVWKYVFNEFLPDPDIEWPGCPVVDRRELGDIGMTLHLFQVIDGKNVALATVPMFSMRIRDQDP